MRISKYYMPLTKEAPAEATTVSHKYSIRAGLIRQASTGIYAWLPLGKKVLSNIQLIIRDEMDALGGVELLMPCIQSADLWRCSGRYDTYGQEMLKIKDRHNRDMLFSPTNEELITDIIRHNIKSYKHLPKCFYQMQWKFRDEIRPRFGLMRCREFLMKDAYSFDTTKENAIIAYQKMYNAYLSIFKKLSLDPIVVRASNGAIGGDLSHEFHVLTTAGDSTIYYDKELKQTGNDFNKLNQIYTAADTLHNDEGCKVSEEDLVIRKSMEIGHIFYFGTKYSKAMSFKVCNEEGELINPKMGSYGIGVSRLMSAIIEEHHDAHGIIWPVSVAPFKIGIVNLHSDSREVSESIYKKLNQTLFDDTDSSIGVKLSRMDLIGVPYQIIVSKKSIESNNVEVKERATGATLQITHTNIENYFNSLFLQ